jgi:hypothetical protein
MNTHRYQRTSPPQKFNFDRWSGECDAITYTPEGAAFSIELLSKLSSGYPDTKFTIESKRTAPQASPVAFVARCRTEIKNVQYIAFFVAFSENIVSLDVPTPSQKQALCLLTDLTGKPVKTYTGLLCDEYFGELLNEALLFWQYEATSQPAKNAIKHDILPIDEETMRHEYSTTVKGTQFSYTFSGEVSVLRKNNVYGLLAPAPFKNAETFVLDDVPAIMFQAFDGFHGILKGGTVCVSSSKVQVLKSLKNSVSTS